MIHSDKCQELSLPNPKGFDTQYSYILRCWLDGHTLNTRVCRYIGIHNFHSVLPKFNKRKIPFTKIRGKVYCPSEKRIPTQDVVAGYMTQEQRQQFLSNKKPA